MNQPVQAPGQESSALTVAPQSVSSFSLVNPATGLVERATADTLAASPSSNLITANVRLCSLLLMLTCSLAPLPAVLAANFEVYSCLFYVLEYGKVFVGHQFAVADMQASDGCMLS